MFGKLLHCNPEKMLMVVNVGSMVALHPLWKSITLDGAWSRFWKEARKVACAVRKQRSREGKAVALSAIKAALGDDISQGWKPFLTLN